MNAVMSALTGSFWQDSNAFTESRTYQGCQEHHREEDHDLKAAAMEGCTACKANESVVIDGPDGEPRVVPIDKLKNKSQRQVLIKATAERGDGEDETEKLLRAIKARFDSAGVVPTDVLVRFKNLSVKGVAAVKPSSMTIKDKAMAALETARYMATGKLTGDMREVPILSGVSGVLKPGKITLLLGPPGAGKSTLIKALSGQLKGVSTLQMTADELTYNGLSFDKFVVERTAAHISQHDVHFGELTVRETLDFSALCQASERRRDLTAQLDEKEKQLGVSPDPVIATYFEAMDRMGKTNLITDIVIKALGLDVCADTVVGNAMLRGVSGGQKKRVTTGEMMVAPMKVLFCDEISTGLDSATTYDVCYRIRALCRLFHATVVVSLLQPTPETYGIFDDVMLLTGGHLVFHGPREMIIPFFESQGFKCPVDKGEADYLQEVTTPGDQIMYWAGERSAYSYVSETGFENAFRKTEAGSASLQELEKPADQEEEGHGELATNRFGPDKFTLLWACFRRQKMMFLRNYAFICIRIVQCLFMSFAVGTLFLHQSKRTLEDGQLFLGVIYFSIMTQMFVSFAAPGLLIQRMPVYLEQRDAHFYPGWCYALPEILMQWPLIFAEAWIWTIMVYFMVGFVTSARLFIFWGIMFCSGIFGLSLFMIVAVLAKHVEVTQAFLDLMTIVFTICSGYVINSEELPGGWIGAFWANPVAYFIRALAVNEFESSDWAFASPDPNLTMGQYILKERGIASSSHWRWIGLFAWGLGSTLFNVFAFCVICCYNTAPSHTVVLTEEEAMRLEGKVNAAFVSQGKSSSNGASNGTGNGISKELADDLKGDPEVGASPSKLKKAALPFTPVVLTFKDIEYSVPLPKDSDAAKDSRGGAHNGNLLLLKGISGTFRPRVCTALMGASGAGKTTLMDVLALRKTGGVITGDVRINGYPQNMETFQRIMGYVEQTDIHVAEATVHEALQFSARLRLPSTVDRARVEEFVEEMMEVVELNNLRDSIIGMPGASGLSTEQRKRHTIAVELVANPPIIFMDEPTSGLDSRAATIVMRAVRNISNTGRTVVCTIHQPSWDIFSKFDELLLLKRGGETIFCGDLGEGCMNLVNYFQGFEGVMPLPQGYNPATWMLEVSSAEAEARSKCNFAEQYKGSALCASIDAQIHQLASPKDGIADLNLADLAPAAFFTQLTELIRRNFAQYKRMWSYNGTRIVITAAIALMFGTAMLYQGQKYDTFNGVLNIAGALYSSVLFVGILNSLMVQSVISCRRTVFYRERASGAYDVLPFALSEFLVEVPYIIVQAAIYSIFVYWMINFIPNAAKFFWFLLILILSLAYWTYFGIHNVHITPSLQIGVAFSAFLYGLFDLFCGFIKPKPQIPGGWIWMYYLNPAAYTLNGLVVGQLGNVNEPFADDPSLTVSQFISQWFGFERSFMWWNVLILVGFSAFFFVNSVLALKFVNWQKR